MFDRHQIWCTRIGKATGGFRGSNSPSFLRTLVGAGAVAKTRIAEKFSNIRGSHVIAIRSHSAAYACISVCCPMAKYSLYFTFRQAQKKHTHTRLHYKSHYRRWGHLANIIAEYRQQQQRTISVDVFLVLDLFGSQHLAVAQLLLWMSWVSGHPQKFGLGCPTPPKCRCTL